MYGVAPSPAELLEDLVEYVIGLSLSPGTESPLLDKLSAAINVLENGNINSAIRKLVEFIGLVNRRRGTQIPDEAADKLISDAQEIIDLLESGEIHRSQIREAVPRR